MATALNFINRSLNGRLGNVIYYERGGQAAMGAAAAARQLVAAIKEQIPGAMVTAVGTNSAATAAMLKAGADRAATGENAVIVNSRKADAVVGPIGIVIADALLGEITPAMAVAVAQCSAKRVLIPVSHCDNIVVGVGEMNYSRLIQEAVDELRKGIDRTC